MSLTTGLIEYHKFDENTGSTVGDSVGSNPGTWAGTLGAQWTTGKIGSGGNFDFNNANYVNGMNPGINANSFSIAWWASTGTQAGTGGGFNNGWQDYWSLDSGGGNKMVIEIQGTGGTLGTIFLFVPTGFVGAGVVNNSTDLRNNGFHHIVLAASTSDNLVTLYVDGSSVSTNTWTVVSTVTTNFLIGNRSTSDNRNITAVLDEFGIWNRSLTATEVSQLYNGGSGIQYPFNMIDQEPNNDLAMARGIQIRT